MRRIATGLLVLMSLLFVATLRWGAEAPVWIGYLRAFAEAAMIGAIADWFAVTALFRHPLGIPIPHTAIIPKRKDQIGASLASFVERNFLTQDVLRAKLATLDFATRLGEWLQVDANARRVAHDGARSLAWLLASVDNQPLQEFMHKRLQFSLREVRVTPFVGRVLRLLTAQNRHQSLMDAAVGIAREQLGENRFRLRLKIAEESPWWVPKFVDEELYDKIVTEIEAFLDRIGDEPDHATRLKFNLATQEFIESLERDPEVIARGERIKDDLLEHPAVQDYLGRTWEHLSDYLLDQAATPNSDLADSFEKALASFGGALLEDPGLREQLNVWLRNAALHLLHNYRDQLTSVIAETVRAWDPELTSRRIELQVGRDLQFIRINGTLVGGLAGLAIHAAVRAF